MSQETSSRTRNTGHLRMHASHPLSAFLPTRQLRVPQGDFDDEIGTDGRTIVYIEEGVVKLVGHLGADREQIAAFAFEGDVLVVPAHVSTPHTLHALEDSVVHFLRSDDMLPKGRPATGAGQLLDRILADLGRSRELSALLGRKSARERICGFLVEMEERIGRRENGAVTLDLPMSRREIGDHLGLTIETVSRQLTDLRERRAIATCGRSRIDILDPQGLRALAGSVD